MAGEESLRLLTVSTQSFVAATACVSTSVQQKINTPKHAIFNVATPCHAISLLQSWASDLNDDPHICHKAILNDLAGDLGLSVPFSGSGSKELEMLHMAVTIE